MKKLLLIAIALIAVSCQNTPDMSLYNANKEIAEKWIRAYESTDLETIKSLTSKDIVHQSPQYGVGEIGYDGILAQANFYMNGYENITFTDAVWLPGVDNTTLISNGGVRVYGTWKGNNKESGKTFSVDSYHWMEVEGGKVVRSGDFFDATGMVMATQPDPAEEEVVE